MLKTNVKVIVQVKMGLNEISPAVLSICFQLCSYVVNLSSLRNFGFDKHMDRY